MLVLATSLFFQYRLFQFFDLSVGVVFLAGAYTFVLVAGFDMSLFCKIMFSVAVAGAVELVIIGGVIRPLYRLEILPLELMLVTLALYVISLNVFALLFGDELYRPSIATDSDIIHFSSFVMLDAQLGIAVLAIANIALIGLLLRYTSFGRVFRALSDSYSLTQDLGLLTLPTIALFVGLGALFVGAVGALTSADIGVRPITAFPYVLTAVGAFLALGGQTFRGVVVGTFAVTAGSQIGGFLFGEQWRELSMFVTVVLLLLVRRRYQWSIP